MSAKSYGSGATSRPLTGESTATRLGDAMKPNLLDVETVAEA